MHPILRAAVLAALATLAVNAAAAEPGEAITIYSKAQPGAVSPELYRSGLRGAAVPGYAVVRQSRSIALQAGTNTVRFTDVAALIDPTTVSFESLTDPKGTSVLEQSYRFDLVSTQKLLEKYIDRRITVDQQRGNAVESFSGTLLSTAGGIVLRRDNGEIQTLASSAGVRLPELPGGLVTRPTLVWTVDAHRAGTHRTRVSYQTRGITWWADYNVTYAQGPRGACGLDVGAWVSILNESGVGYTNAKLKLVAGDVQRAAPPQYAVPMALGAARLAEAKRAGFAEKAFFEYHLYTLGRPVDLPDRSTKQIELFPAAHGVACEKTLVYQGLAPGWRGRYSGPLTERNYGMQTNKKVDVYLSFRNAKENGLGIPLPAGRIRVSKEDTADGSLEFIGEDVVDHTPKDETVMIKLGSAFDVVGERRQTDFSVDTRAHTMTESIEVKLRNHKSEPVTVLVKENLYRWVDWEIVRENHDFRKVDSRTIEFPVKIAANGEQTVDYTVRYTW